MNIDLENLREELCDACDENDLETCKRLLKVIDPNFENIGYGSPIEASIDGNNIEITDLLIKHGASLEPREGLSSLLQSANYYREGHGFGFEMRSFLFSKGINPDYLVNGISALMDAINNGYYAWAEEYLDANALVDVVDQDGWTPVNRIVATIGDGHSSIPGMLGLDNKEYLERLNERLSTRTTRDEFISFNDPNKWNFWDEEDYRSSKRESGIQLLKKLIEKGADVNRPNNYGWSPLLYASGSKEMFDVCKMLVEAGANPNTIDIFGEYTPLMRACDRCATELALFLLENGANPNYRDPLSGYTPLTRACIDLDYELSRKLIEKGADVNSLSDDGSSPLLWMLAVNRALIGLVDKANEEKASSQANESDETIINFPYNPTLLNEWLNNIERMIRLLVENGAELFFRNHNNENVYDILHTSYLLDSLKDVIPPIGPR